MGNKIVYGNYTFTDDVILSAQLTLSNAMVSESLSGDEFKFTVYSTQTTDLNYLRTVLNEYYTTVNDEHFGLYFGAIQNYTYGAPIYYYKDEVLQGKFYVSNVTRTGEYAFSFECVSAIGLLIKITHSGGVYEGTSTTVGGLVRAIFSKINAVEDTDYIIDSEIDNVVINGWLPYASCRDNLRQILFAIGGSITKTDEGILILKYINSPTLINIPDEKIYQGGSVNYLAPCSMVEVWEHEYHKLDIDELKVLFDNTENDSADHQLVTFNEPYHPDIDTGEWETTGTITIHEIGANYAILSGQGTLSGYKYTHTTRVIKEAVLNSGTSSIVTVKDATLVSTVNSINVAKRVAKYYSQAKEISCEVVMDGTNQIKPSSKVSFTNPFGEQTVGYVKTMDITVSKTNKAQTVISTDWTPSYFGNNYGTSILLTSGTTWTSPKTGVVKAVLIQGGQGGQGGFNGASGDGGTNWNYWSDSYDARESIPHHGVGGLGGNKGSGGSGGKILSLDLNVVQGTTYQITIGQGGAGGASNGGLGSYGTDSTITVGDTTYTSANGQVKEYGYVDMFNGNVYGQSGWNGINGQDATQVENQYGSIEEETVQVQTSNDAYTSFLLQRGNHSSTNFADSYLAGGYGADGGAGAFCYPSQYGTNATEPSAESVSGAYWGYGAVGGNGANAINIQQFISSQYNVGGLTYSLNVGQGGVGGNGGGGGGGGGDAVHAYDKECYARSGAGGSGGTGSTGCTGANGGILIYY